MAASSCQCMDEIGDCRLSSLIEPLRAFGMMQVYFLTGGG